jgi:hypothetical protein
MPSPAVPDDAPLRIVTLYAATQLYHVLVDRPPDAGLATALARLRRFQASIADGTSDLDIHIADCRSLDDLRDLAHGVAKVLAADGRTTMLADVHALTDLAQALEPALRGRARR